MRLTRRAMAAAVANFFLQSLALSVALLKPEPEHQALVEQMSFTSRKQDRRSLRRVHQGSPHVSPSLSESRSRTGGGLGVGAIIGIVVSCVCFVLVVTVAVVCRMRKKTDPEWGLLRSFKRRNPKPVVDEEKLFAQAKGDTHLSAF